MCRRASRSALRRLRRARESPGPLPCHSATPAPFFRQPTVKGRLPLPIPPVLKPVKRRSAKAAATPHKARHGVCCVTTNVLTPFTIFRAGWRHQEGLRLRQETERGAGPFDCPRRVPIRAPPFSRPYRRLLRPHLRPAKKTNAIMAWVDSARLVRRLCGRPEIAHSSWCASAFHLSRRMEERRSRSVRPR